MQPILRWERWAMWALPRRTIPLWLLGGGSMLTVLAWLLNNTPEVARTQTAIIVLMLLADSLTGVAAAGLERKVSSHRMRTRCIAKTAQYVGFVVLTAGPSLLLKNWLPIECALTAIIMFEGVSILENMYRLERLGGVNMGHAKPLLAWVGKFLDIPQDAPPPPEPRVSTSEEAKKEISIP